MAFDDENNATFPQSVVGSTDLAKQEEYSTQGRTTVATRRGYAFQSSEQSEEDSNFPLVTHAGVQVTKEQAEALVTESGGVVYIVTDEKED